MKNILTAALIVFSFVRPMAQVPETRVIGYLPTWGSFDSNVSKTDFSKYTHINLAFANPDANGAVTFSDLQASQVTSVVSGCHAVGSMILASIGGAAVDNELWLKYLSPEFRNVVIQSIADLVSTYSFDGIDLDLEGDLVLSSDYLGFVAALHDALPENVLFTAALATWSANSLTFDVLDRYDFVNIMSYDYTGPWNPTQPGQHSSYQNAVKDLNYWKNKGFSADRVVLGVPFYGYNFQDASHVYYMPYKDIVKAHEGAGDHDQMGTIYYNGVATIRSKTELALTHGGIMIWEITQDVNYADDRSLLAAIWGVIRPDESPTGIPVIDSLTVYPNPVSETLSISEEFRSGRIMIADLEGKVVLDQKVRDGNVDVRSLKIGVYIASITSGNRETKVRFIKD